MQAGAKVRLQGLTGRAALNGELAVLLSFDAAKARWICRVVSSGVTLSVPEAACVAVASGAAAAHGAEWDIARTLATELAARSGPEMVCGIALLLACTLGFLGPAQLLPLEHAGSALPFDRAALEQASRTASGALLLAFGWACLSIYVLWHALPMSFMSKHFVLSATNVEQGRYWTVLSCEISHKNLPHILANMAGLLAATPGLAKSEPFVGIAGLLVACAACSSAASLYGWRAVAGKTDEVSSSLGASGVVLGLMVADAIRSPAHEVVLYGMTMSSQSALLVQAVAECALGVLSAKGGVPTFLGVGVDEALGGGLSRLRGIDVFAHFGGALTGFLYCAIAKRFG